MGELAVSGKLERAVVHIAVDLIGIALFDQSLDDLDDPFLKEGLRLMFSYLLQIHVEVFRTLFLLL